MISKVVCDKIYRRFEKIDIFPVKHDRKNNGAHREDKKNGVICFQRYLPQTKWSPYILLNFSSLTVHVISTNVVTIPSCHLCCSILDLVLRQSSPTGTTSLCCNMAVDDAALRRFERL